MQTFLLLSLSVTTLLLALRAHLWRRDCEFNARLLADARARMSDYQQRTDRQLTRSDAHVESLLADIAKLREQLVEANSRLAVSTAARGVLADTAKRRLAADPEPGTEG